MDEEGYLIWRNQGKEVSYIHSQAFENISRIYNYATFVYELEKGELENLQKIDHIIRIKMEEFRVRKILIIEQPVKNSMEMKRKGEAEIEEFVERNQFEGKYAEVAYEMGELRNYNKSFL